ncbi:hypothetical protein ACEPAF_2071 [Sanghuangporus sanghuang]
MIFTGKIVLHLDIVGEMMGVDISLATVHEDIRRSKIMRYGGTSGVTQSINNRVFQLFEQGDPCQAIGNLLVKLDTFRQVMNVLSEIHPFHGS